MSNSRSNIQPQNYLLTWVMLACFVFVLMLTHQSEDAVFLGRYSNDYMLHFGILGSGIVIAFLLAITSPKFLKTQIRSSWGGILWVGLFGIAILWSWFNISDDSRLFRLFVMISLIYFMVLPLQQTPMFQLPIWVYGIGAFAICIMVIVLYLGKVPPAPIFDEALVARWAVQFFRTGDATLYTHFINMPYISLYPMGALLNTFGITFINARLIALFIILLCLPFMYVIIQRLFGQKIAFFTMTYGVLLSFQLSYFRPDLLIPLSIAIGIVYYDHARGRFWWYVISGFAFASTLEAHVLGLVYGVALGIILTYQYARTLINTCKFFWYKPFWGLLIGGILFVGVFFAIRIFVLGISIPEYFENSSIVYAFEQNLFKEFTFAERVPIIFGQNIMLLAIHHPLNFIIILLGLFLSTRLPKIRLWLGVVVIGWILFAFLNPKFSYLYYYVHTLPLVLLIFAGLLDYLEHRISKFASIAVMFISLAFTIAWIDYQTLYQNSQDLIVAGLDMNEILPEKTQTIIGWEIYYWGFHERDFIFTYAFQGQEFLTPGDEPPVDDVLQRFNLPPTDAIILTQGRDDTLINLLNYIQENNFERAKCYDAPQMNTSAELYVRPNLIPNIRDVDCR
jgi:hypothetical protein